MGGKRGAIVLVAGVLSMVGTWPVSAAPPSDAATRAGNFLASQQQSDGTWPSGSSADDVAEFVVALVSADVTGAPLNKALTYVADHAPTDANRASATARVILAAAAGGRDPRDFGHVDYVGRLRGYYNPASGDYDPATQPNALAVIALAAANEKAPEHAVGALQARQCDDGGYSRSTCLLGSDTPTTALALAALVSQNVGTSDPVVGKARGYLANAENPDGGFAMNAGGPSASEATGLAVAALGALGEDPQTSPWRKSPNADPWTLLVALQDSSGGLKTDTTTSAPDDRATARALPGLAGMALPVRPHAAPVTQATHGGEGAPPGETATSAPVATPTTAARGRARARAERTTTTVAGKSDEKKGDAALAAPAARHNGGRSIKALLPFVLTLFGAGAVGIVLRRRART